MTRPLRETTVATRATCRRPGCEKEAGRGRRGLCNSDYQAVARYVALGMITWKEAERRGVVAPKRSTVKDWLFAGT